ncbi:MAG: mRNA interferase MazF [Candidatus Kentron sp. G]|nr:MAG: mRNA interferase MazF [Candidatus Kentron sp. G]VFN01319.1 MAG: mRNA interferase MazF [Candidatus Kentron sp. G]VFN05396.1 MAG: mRNA interferase MazF [Candidatus Kentron sp. G]
MQDHALLVWGAASLGMVSSQCHHGIAGIDEIVRPEDTDFAQSGLKMPSVIRATRLAVVTADVLQQGAIGSLPEARLGRIRGNIARWISGSA